MATSGFAPRRRRCCIPRCRGERARSAPGEGLGAAVWPFAQRCRRPSARTGRSERIGIFGGTFDPPHIGHVAALRAVTDALALDRLLLVVANDPWQKSSTRAVTPAEDRFAMAQALAEAHSRGRGQPDGDRPRWAELHGDDGRSAPGGGRRRGAARPADLSGRSGPTCCLTWGHGSGRTICGAGHPGRRLASALDHDRDGATPHGPTRLAGGVGRWPAGRRLQLGRAGRARAGRLRRRFGAGRSNALHSPPQSVRCRQMSALPAETTDLSPRPLAVRPSAAGSQLRAERRAEQAQGAPGPVSLVGRRSDHPLLFVRPHRGSPGRAPLSPGLGRPRPASRRLRPRRQRRPTPSSGRTPSCWP